MKYIILREINIPEERRYLADAYPAAGAYLLPDGTITFVSSSPQGSGFLPMMQTMTPEQTRTLITERLPANEGVDAHRLLDQVIEIAHLRGDRTP